MIRLTPSAHGYSASLISLEHGAEPVGGTLLPGASELRFQSGKETVNIPWPNLEVAFERGGPGIFLSDCERPEVRIYVARQTILRHPALKAHPQVAGAVGRRELARAVRLTAYFAAGCAVAVWLGSLATSAMVRAIAARAPAQWEEKIGREEIGSLRTNNLLLDDSNDVAQLTALARPLMEALPPDRRALTFYIAKSAEPNAFALPGGAVVVNAGLLQLTDQPDEILGVLAHELAHQTKRHVIRRSIAAAGPLVIFGIFLHSGSGVGNLITLGSGLIVFQGFSQAYETEADDVGWDYLVKANIDPRGMIHIFQKLERVEAKMGVSEREPQAWQSHPATAARIARLEKRWANLPRKSGFIALPALRWDAAKIGAAP